jgi:hypothetical protein
VKGVLLCEAEGEVFLGSVGLDQFLRIWQVHIRGICGAAQEGAGGSADEQASIERDDAWSVDLAEIASFKVDVCEPSCVHGYAEAAAREACTEGVVRNMNGGNRPTSAQEDLPDKGSRGQLVVVWTLMVAGRGTQILRVNLS